VVAGAAQEPMRPSGVTICMAIKPINTPAEPDVISTVKARGGVIGNKVRYVLAISLLLAVAAMIFAYLCVPGDMMNGTTRAPGATGMH